MSGQLCEEMVPINEADLIHGVLARWILVLTSSLMKDKMSSPWVLIPTAAEQAFVFSAQAG